MNKERKIKRMMIINMKKNTNQVKRNRGTPDKANLKYQGDSKRMNETFCGMMSNKSSHYNLVMCVQFR